MVPIQAPAPVGGSGTHATALLVEDSVSQRAVLKAMLERLGCRCDAAEDGRKGVVAALSGAYDFIFMDVLMPEMDGFAATRFIREKMGPHSPFIVAVTCLHSDTDRRRCMEAGMDYFLSKPVRKDALELLLGG
jgi:CheY-like chemotaxis protein